MLSGAYGEVVEASLSARERSAMGDILSIPKDIDLLRRLIIIGGVTYAIAGSISSDKTYISTADVISSGALVEEGMLRNFFVGADMNGDFRTKQVSVAALSYVTPQGDRAPFGPKEEILIPFYHSSELEILRSALTHLVIQQGVDPKQLKQDIFELINKTSRNKSELIVSGRKLFADFGDSSDVVNLCLAHGEFIDMKANHKPGEEVELFSNFPFAYNGDRKTSSNIISTSKGLIFRYAGGGVNTEEWAIPNEIVPIYVAALCSQEFGRTDSESMKRFVSLIDLSPKEVKQTLLDI